MKYLYVWTRKFVICVCAVTLVASLTPSWGIAAAAKTTKKKSKRVRISGSQLYRRLDSIDKQLQKMAKQSAAAPKAAPVSPGKSSMGGDAMARAFYNHGVYKKQSASLRMTAHLLRGIAILGGGSAMMIGWQKEGDKLNRFPRSRNVRTIHNSYKAYPWFSYGLTTAVLGVTVSYVLDIMAINSDRKAAKALMEPVASGN